MQSPLQKTNIHPAWTLIGILLIAANLRAPFTGVAPLLGELRSMFSFSATQAGLLITLPLLAFAAVSPFAAGLAKRWGLERVLFLSLLGIAAGIALRSTGLVTNLFIGTCIIGAAIAIGNVLLPSLLKRDYPKHVAPLTSLYVLVMGIAAAGCSVLAIPLSNLPGFDWRAVMGSAIVLPAIAVLAWLPRLRTGSGVAQVVGTHTEKALLRKSPLAWQVTFYLGLDCFLYYVGVSWLPAILQDAGYTTAQAGSLHGVLLLSTALPGLLLIPLVPKLRDQRALASLLSLSIVIGLLGLTLAAQWAVVWILFFGFGAGGGLILALAFISLRTSHAEDAAGLSGMAQCLGYSLAAAGPPLIGRLHDLGGNWSLPLGLCAILGVSMACVGLLAGRNLQIAVPTPA